MPAHLPAPRAVLGHPRRARACARSSSSPARALLAALPLDHLRLRRVPRLTGVKLLLQRDERDRTRSETAGRALVPAARPRHATSYRRRPLLRAEGRPAAARRRCSRARRWSRSRDLIFAVDSIPAIFAVTTRPVHRLHLEHLRDPRAALAVLPARGRDRRSSCYLKLGLVARARLRRREDAADGRATRSRSASRSA